MLGSRLSSSSSEFDDISVSIDSSICRGCFSSDEDNKSSSISDFDEGHILV